ncbi:MAG: DUF3726 domain-containing protein [Thiolinea sp.]
MRRYSLSEIDAQVKKAVRGAGFSWGHAEEAGKAARFLAAQQLPGAALVAAYLQEREQEPQSFATQEQVGYWQVTASGERFLCPVLAAASLLDTADVASGWAEQGAVRLHRVAYPLLLLPALSVWAQARDVTLTLGWEAAELACREGCVQVDALEMAVLACTRAAFLDIKVTDAPLPQAREPRPVGQALDDTVWQALDAFARRTYVAATEASRRGAGPAD